jgi:hypothetical protein
MSSPCVSLQERFCSRPEGSAPSVPKRSWRHERLPRECARRKVPGTLKVLGFPAPCRGGPGAASLSQGPALRAPSGGHVDPVIDRSSWAVRPRLPGGDTRSAARGANLHPSPIPHGAGLGRRIRRRLLPYARSASSVLRLRPAWTPLPGYASGLRLGTAGLRPGDAGCPRPALSLSKGRKPCIHRPLRRIALRLRSGQATTVGEKCRLNSRS